AGVTPDAPPGATTGGQPHNHPRLRPPRHRAHDDRVEEHAVLTLLLLDLLGPAREAEAAQPVIRRAGRDRVRTAAGRLDVGDGPFPALLEADPEAGLDQSHVRAQDPAEEDVAHAVVHGVRPVHPALLD